MEPPKASRGEMPTHMVDEGRLAISPEDGEEMRLQKGATAAQPPTCSRRMLKEARGDLEEVRMPMAETVETGPSEATVAMQPPLEDREEPEAGVTARTALFRPERVEAAVVVGMPKPSEELEELEAHCRAGTAEMRPPMAESVETEGTASVNAAKVGRD